MSLRPLALLFLRLTFLYLIISFNQAQANFYKRYQIDSIKAVLNTQHGIDEIHTLINLAGGYNSFQLDSAMLYAEQAYVKSREIHYEWGMVKSVYSKCRTLYEMGPLDEIIPVLGHCLAWFKAKGFHEDYLQGGLSYTSLIISYHGKRKGHDLAVNMLKETQKYGDPKYIGKAWFNYAQVEEVWVVESKFEENIDSAIYYATLAKDSMLLVYAQYSKLTTDFFNTSHTETFRKAYQQAKRWGNRKVICFTSTSLHKNFAKRGMLDSCQLYFEKTYETALILGNIKSQQKALEINGHANIFMGNINTALEYFETSINLCKAYGYRLVVVAIMHQAAVALGNIGRYEESIAMTIQTKEYAKAVDSDLQFMLSSKMLANTHVLTNKLDRAEQEYYDILDWLKTNIPEHMSELYFASTYKELGVIAKKREQYDKARSFFRLALEKIPYWKKPRSVALTHNHILISFLNENDYDNANQVYLEMIDKYDQSILETIPEFYLSKGYLLIHGREYNAAHTALLKFFKTSNHQKYSNEQKDAYLQLSKVKAKLGHHEQAYDALKKYQEIKDILESRKTIENVEKIQSDYELSLKESEIKRLEQQQEISDLKLVQQENALSLRKLYIALLIVAFLLVGIVGYFLFRRLRTKKELEKKEVEEQLKIENLKTRQKAEIAEVKNNLYANISHEIKTPLTLIRVPLQNFYNNAKGEDQDMFQAVIKNTDYLIEMLDEMLGVSQIESGQIELQSGKFNCAVLLSQIKLNFAPLFSEKNIHFDWEIDLIKNDFYGDENKLNIVISNLLKNAFNNTTENGWVKCQVHLDQSLKVMVSNQGGPIDKKDLPHLFERHYRADKNKYKGAGIGLSWSKQIVGLHQGTMEVRNGEDEVIFSVSIPDTEPKEETTFSSNGVKSKVGSVTPVEAIEKRNGSLEALQHILVVEDNIEIQALLKSTLEANYRLDFAENGKIGEEMAIDLQPDLVLSDVMMPEKDGFELLKSLKENFNSSHIPVILLTAKSDSASRIAGLNQDADDYIGKPFNPNELRARIDNLIRQRLHLHKLFSENPLLYSKEINCTALDANFIDQARQILEEHYIDGNFDVSQFCRELALNRTSVNTKIRALTNQSTAEYIKNFRLQKAAKLLIETPKSIAEITLDSGFNNSQVFNKAFKKKFSATPSLYRSEFKK